MRPLARVAAPLVVLSLVACGGSPPLRTHREPPRRADTPPETPDALADIPGRPPTVGESRAIRRLLDYAERVRDLEFAQPVPFRIQSREVITQFVRDQMEPEELERARIFYVALGLLDPELDIEALLVEVLGEQIVGYYDPDQGLMVVREDVMQQLDGRRASELGQAEMVIVHELVHALQDQRLDLGERYEEERTIDAENAFGAVVEGDATLAMIGHQASIGGVPLSRLTQNVGLLRMQVDGAAGANGGEAMDAAPAIVRLPLVLRYTEGMLFCATLHGQGQDWRGVDRAHRSPPASSEHILHPERYIAGHAPIPVALPELPELTASGLEVHDEDTLGELEMGIYFGLADGSDRDTSAADGWGGDRLRVYRDPASGRPGLVWFMAWDDEGEAIEAERAAETIRAAMPPAIQARHHVRRSGRALLVVRDLDPSLHPVIEAAFDGFSTALSEAAAPTLDAPQPQG
ncbi:MAG: hypothetical protein AB8I08_36240 [Sandaracinaceae bacterium]